MGIGSPGWNPYLLLSSLPFLLSYTSSRLRRADTHGSRERGESLLVTLEISLQQMCLGNGSAEHKSVAQYFWMLSGIARVTEG